MKTHKTKALILGGSGFLGINFVRYCSNFDLTLTYSKTLPTITADWRKFNFVEDDEKFLSSIFSDVAPEIVINCIALADVDQCEKDPDKAFRLNSLLPMSLSRIAREFNTKLIHISTDHFKSMNVSPRSEQSELWTTNIYGKSKLDGEKSITSENLNALILRTNFFGFSYRQHNSLLERIIDTIQLKHDFNGFTDVHFNPVSVLYLIRAIEHLNAIDAKGTFNIVSNSVITKFDFAIMVAQIFDLDENHVIPSISRGNKNFVDRPNYLALSPAKYLKTHPPRIPSLEEMLLELKEDTLWSDKLRS